MNDKANIVVLGATGHFGKRISRRLCSEPHTVLTVTSRDPGKAKALSEELAGQTGGARVHGKALDQHAADFETRLADLNPDVVVHTAGPYQGQNYRVAKACLACGSHYIDLSDGRAYVEGFSALDKEALDKDRLLVTGASTLPGLSSVVVSELSCRFSRIDSIEISIAPAHQTPRGFGTVAAVLSYCGQPFEVLVNGRWEQRFGWQDLKQFRYPDLGWRAGAACDVPDLGLFPSRLDTLKSVTFHAALEAKWEQAALWMMAAAVRIGLAKDWSRHASHFQRISRRFVSWGSARGGMHIKLQGLHKDDTDRAVTWFLTADRNHGPEVPCTPALILVRKMAKGEITARGALPCWNLFSLEDFDDEISAFDVRWTTRDSQDP